MFRLWRTSEDVAGGWAAGVAGAMRGGGALGAAGNIVVVGWEKTMAKASCYSCVYAFWDKGKWLWGLGLGMPLGGKRSQSLTN